jgi:hypothetical protein
MLNLACSSEYFGGIGKDITSFCIVAEQLIKEFIEKYGMGRDWSEFL